MAVLGVALDHAGFQILSGGFVGVDVFFVISGFLITGLLLKEGRKGRISLREFYSRRARRILPAATLVILVTTVASLYLLGFVRAKAVITDAIWSALFAANIKFGQDGTDYFTAEMPPSPLQHYWSLAVEEQFYFVWPILLILLMGAVWGTGGRTGVPRRRLFVALAVVSAASLTYSVILTAHEPTAAYFSTPARAWELAAGAAVAVGSPYISRFPELLKAALSWTGLVGIVVACVVYSPATAFPGHAVALPVLGSAFVLAGGTGEVRRGAGLLLDRQPFQLVGDWSYSFYLWHWPALIIAAGYLGRDLSSGEAMAALGLALLAAATTYYLVENPFRRSPFLSRRVNLGLALYPASIVAIAVAVVFAQSGVRQQAEAMADSPALNIERIAREASEPLSKDPAVRAVQATVRAARDGAPVPGSLSPSLLTLGTSKADTGGCHSSGQQTTNKICETGVPGSARTLVLFGDSHARAWIPAVETTARREGWSAYYFIKVGCSGASITPYGEPGGARTVCDQWRSWVLDQIAQISPDVAIVSSDVPPGVISPETGQPVMDDKHVATLWGEAYAQTMATLGKSADRVIALGDVPGLEQDPGECLTAPHVELADCMFPSSGRSVLMNHAARRAARSAGADFVEATRWFCADDSCPAVVGSFIAYRDDEHISAPYARSLARAVGKALDL